MGHEHRNRGKESNDDKLFSPDKIPVFTDALDDYCYLLTRGYGAKSSVALVGNRYRLNVRQQKALRNMGASEAQIALRNERSVSPDALEGQIVKLDGFNVLIILETAFSGGFLFKGRDGYYRDITGVHGGYKRISKTGAVLRLIGETLAALKVKKVQWFLDKPVSNSGRLAAFIRETAEENEFINWEVHLDHNPDRVLAESEHIAISSDAWVLDEAAHNFNFIAEITGRVNQNKEFNVFAP